MKRWEQVPLRRIFRVVNGGTPTSDTDNWDGAVPWATPTDLGRYSGGLITSTARTLSAHGLKTGSAAVPNDSLVVSTRAPIGYVVQTVGPLAFNQGCRGLTPARSLDLRYYRYVLVALGDHMQASGQGSTFVELSTDVLASTRLPLPPSAAQRRIADFLDAETARIDALIAKKLELVEVLRHRRWAILAAESRAADAPIVPLRRTLVCITDGPFGSAFSSSEYSEEGVAVVRLGNIGFATWRGDDIAHLPAHRFEEFSHYRVEEGNLLLAGLGDPKNHAGRACVAPDLGAAIVKGKCFCGRVDRSVANPEYLALFCSSPSGADAIAAEARGSTRSMINLEIVKAMPVPLPELQAQRKIVANVHSVWEKTNSIRELLLRQIALLQERRKTLITAAVTGELDIGGAA